MVCTVIGASPSNRHVAHHNLTAFAAVNIAPRTDVVQRHEKPSNDRRSVRQHRQTVRKEQAVARSYSSGATPCSLKRFGFGIPSRTRRRWPTWQADSFASMRPHPKAGSDVTDPFGPPDQRIDRPWQSRSRRLSPVRNVGGSSVAGTFHVSPACITSFNTTVPSAARTRTHDGRTATICNAGAGPSTTCGTFNASAAVGAFTPAINRCIGNGAPQSCPRTGVNIGNRPHHAEPEPAHPRLADGTTGQAHHRAGLRHRGAAGSISSEGAATDFVNGSRSANTTGVCSIGATCTRCTSCNTEYPPKPMAPINATRTRDDPIAPGSTRLQMLSPVGTNGVAGAQRYQTAAAGQAIFAGRFFNNGGFCRHAVGHCENRFPRRRCQTRGQDPCSGSAHKSARNRR